jgi:translation initiation factor SUI1
MDKLLSLKPKKPVAEATASATVTAAPLPPKLKPIQVEKPLPPVGPGSQKVHIWTKQMGKKWITTIEDLDEDLDLVKISKYMKRSLNCAVDVVEDEKTGKEVIKIQGNHRDEVAAWIVDNEVMTEKEAKERLVKHGV